MNYHWVRNSAWKKSWNIQIYLLQGAGGTFSKWLCATDRINFPFLLLAVRLCGAWQRRLTDRTKLYFLLVLVWCCQPEHLLECPGALRKGSVSSQEAGTVACRLLKWAVLQPGATPALLGRKPVRLSNWQQGGRGSSWSILCQGQA